MSHSEFACVKAAPIFSHLPDDIIAQLVTISTHQKNIQLEAISMNQTMIYQRFSSSILVKLTFLT